MVTIQVCKVIVHTSILFALGVKSRPFGILHALDLPVAKNLEKCRILCFGNMQHVQEGFILNLLFCEKNSRSLLVTATIFVFSFVGILAYSFICNCKNINVFN